MTRETLPEKLRVLRARQGLTVAEAAARMGIQRHTLRDLERARRTPTFPTLHKIAEGYGVPVEELMEEPAPKAETSPDITYLELLELAGAEDSGLERPIERDTPGNINELFEGLSYGEAYQLYQHLARKRKSVRRIVEVLLRRDLDPATERKIKGFDALVYQRMLVAFGIVYAKLEEARANTPILEEAEEIEELQNKLTLAAAG